VVGHPHGWPSIKCFPWLSFMVFFVHFLPWAHTLGAALHVSVHCRHTQCFTQKHTWWGACHLLFIYQQWLSGYNSLIEHLPCTRYLAHLPPFFYFNNREAESLFSMQSFALTLKNACCLYHRPNHYSPSPPHYLLVFASSFARCTHTHTISLITHTAHRCWNVQTQNKLQQ
jgi:hypothetical protein